LVEPLEETVPENLAAIGIAREKDHMSSEMAAARVCLDQALARMGELSVVDRERLTYLEQSTVDKREATEDLFHTANNALFAITVNLELLTRHLSLKGECEHREVKKWLALLMRKTKEIGTVTRRLLTAGTEGPFYLIQTFVSLRSVIERALEIYEDIARDKNIEIAWQLPAFPAIAIWTDAVAVGTVLDNLLSNAIKFSEPGNTIAVTMTRNGTELICAVSDNGPGLSEDDQSRVFQRGAQLGPKPTGGESSSGYGLAAARDVVERLGGRIWCESVEGKGSSFMFSLPMVVAVARSAAG
jgi:signal transduction histidine kinase